MIGSQHLTLTQAAQIDTYPGQAHFAIPDARETCWRCRFWDARSDREQHAVCLKAQRLTPGRRTQKVPWNARVCRYFEPKNQIAVR
jgi:hypothetical protein